MSTGKSVTSTGSDLLEAVLQPARNMRGAEYCLYSSATVLIFTLACSIYEFSLDPPILFVIEINDNFIRGQKFKAKRIQQRPKTSGVVINKRFS